jgi:hypothetical protein
MLQTTSRGFENLFYQNRSGLLDDSYWAGYAKTIQTLVKTAGFQYFWQHRRGRFSDEFEPFIEELLSSS